MLIAAMIIVIAHLAVTETDALSIPETVRIRDASVTQTTCTIKWNRSIGAEGYCIYRKTEGGTYRKITTIKGGKKTSYKDVKLTPYTGYSYKIRAYKENVRKGIVSKAYGKLSSPGTVVTLSHLNNHSVLIEGDSIQAGYGKYLETAASNMGAGRVVNNAVYGATLAERADGNINSVYTRIMNLSDDEIKSFDYIFIAAGTNDYGRASNHGISMPGKYDSDDPQTSCGALNQILTRIKEVAPKTIVIVCPPIYRFHGWNDDDYSTRVKMDNDELANRYGFYLQNYVSRIKRTAMNEKYRNVVIINQSRLVSKAEMADENNSADGLHPRKSFAEKVIAKRAEREINRRLIGNRALNR